MSAHTEVLVRYFAALNRNDLEAAVRDFDPEIVRVEFEGTPTGRTYRGIAEFRELVWKARDTWAEGSCAPEQFLENGDKVVAYVHVRVRLKDKTEWLEGRIADGFAFRNGRIVEYHSFMERPVALKWAGIKD
jgi:ketosteroid isomerase-like protein